MAPGDAEAICQMRWRHEARISSMFRNWSDLERQGFIATLRLGDAVGRSVPQTSRYFVEPYAISICRSGGWRKDDRIRR